MDKTLDPTTQNNIDQWLNGPYDTETKAAIQKMLIKKPKEAIDAFYTNLTFGTGGLRGIMGVGTNRMNRYTVCAAAQGLANYINQQPKPPAGHSVFIGYDSRHHSRDFAEQTARVMAGNGIKAYIYKELRPTPMISFGCRFKKCSAAVMITASHNPPEYNGFKVYWSDGAQILPPHDKNIIAEVKKISSPTQVKSTGSLEHPFIQRVGEEIDQAYFRAIEPLQIYPEINKKFGTQLKVVYTSLHGAGITAVPQALQQAGFINLQFVDKQVIPDGDFPTVKSPNPEEISALTLGIEKLKQSQAELLIATDPDTDRIGVASYHKGEIQLFNGNQIACILLYQVLEALKEQKRLPARAAFIKTIATTELFKAICDSFGVACFDVLTGFKYIAELIHRWEKDPNGYHYIFGGEESYGYLLGAETRDKDAITASVLICEVALHAKQQSKTLLNLLHDLYNKYGYYYEQLLSVDYPDTKEGREKMANGMAKLLKAPPKVIAGLSAETIEDYQTSIRTILKTGKTETLTLPQSNVLVFWLEDGSKLMIRPSGTEPKIKLYAGVVQKKFTSLQDAELACKKHATTLLETLQSCI